MESKNVIEIKEIIEKEEKTKAWGPNPQEENDRTRCWGPCPPPAPPSDEEELEELEIA